MPGFNIEVFKSEVNRRAGIMKNNKFLMTFVPPEITGQVQSIGRSIEYWCDATSLPGYQLMMGDTRRWTYGPHEKRPFGPNIVSLQTVFISDANGDMLKFFNGWLNHIVPHYVSKSFTANADGTGGTKYPYEIEYKEKYVTDIHIYVFREDGLPTLHYVCKEAFPSHIMDIPVAWDSTNSFMKFQITFDYLDWYMEEVSQPTLPTQIQDAKGFPIGSKGAGPGVINDGVDRGGLPPFKPAL